MRRLLTAFALIPPVVCLVLWAPDWAVLTTAAAVACLCFYEYCGIAEKLQPGIHGPLGYAAGLLLLVLPTDTWLLLTLLTIAALALGMRSANLAETLPRSAFLLLGVVYIFGCWKCALPIRAVNPHWLMFALLLNWVGDAGAYYVGRNFGKHKLAPRISPGKTVEGAAGSVVAAMLLGGGYLMYFVPTVPLWQALAVTAAANAAGQIGDLAESALKRGAGVKDSGSLLPGHGGMLDRVDSTLFALPVIYAYLRMI
jgi:phosphatidate cytidylyltransferase